MADEILGIDLNAYRPNLTRADFEKLAEGGCQFLFNRLSLGTTTYDETAPQYLPMAEDQGWVTGVYHYLKATPDTDPLEDGAEQAAFFLESIDELTRTPDFIFLDVEEHGLEWGHIVGWVERVRAAVMAVGLYTRETYYEPRFGDKPDIFDYRWLANYIGTEKRWLSDWRTPAEVERYRPDAEVWQFTDAFQWKSPSGPIRSVDGNVASVRSQKAMLDLTTQRITIE